MVSSSEDLMLALKEALRYGLFLGCFAVTFVSVDEFLASLGSHQRGNNSSTLLASNWIQYAAQSSAVYILMGAAVLAARCGMKSKVFGRICKTLTWAHGLTEVQVLMVVLRLRQESLPPSYKSFLNKHGAKDAFILQGVREIESGLPSSNVEGIEKYYK